MEHDDQGPAPSILSMDVGKETSLSLGKTTTRVYHPRCYRRIARKKKKKKTTFRQRRVKTRVHSLRYRRRISRNDDVSIKARQKTAPAQGKRAPAQGRLGRRPGSSILDTVAGYWEENVTLPRKDDDQGPASSILSTNIGKKASLCLGKTTPQHPRYYRRILGRKRHCT